MPFWWNSPLSFVRCLHFQMDLLRLRLKLLQGGCKKLHALCDLCGRSSTGSPRQILLFVFDLDHLPHDCLGFVHLDLGHCEGFSRSLNALLMIRLLCLEKAGIFLPSLHSVCEERLPRRNEIGSGL